MRSGGSLKIKDQSFSIITKNIGCIHETFKNHEGWSLSKTRIVMPDDTQWMSSTQAGLYVGVIEGRMKFEFNKGSISSFNRQFGYFLKASGPVTTHHSISADEEITGTFLHIPQQALLHLEKQHHDITNRELLQNNDRQNNDLQCFMPDERLIRLCHEIHNCSYENGLRSLYFEGKSFEFLALAFENLFLKPSSLTDNDKFIPHHEIERFMHIRDILIASLSEPPSLAQLSRQVGISTSRLTAGFRKVFSMSIVEFLQHQRLEYARQMLRENKMSISQIAYKIGYTPAHFSTLFRRHYGYPPRHLLQNDK